MTEFCGCNSEWKAEEFEYRFNRSQHTMSKDGTRDEFYCMKCGYWVWNDHHYENMMFDLRNMNRC